MVSRSKGYGFVSYRTRQGAERAVSEMSGVMVGARRVRCGWAHHKQDILLGADYTTVDQVWPPGRWTSSEQALKKSCIEMMFHPQCQMAFLFRLRGASTSSLSDQFGCGKIQF